MRVQRCFFHSRHAIAAENRQELESARFAELGEHFLDLIVEREPPDLSLGKDFPAVRNYVELAGLTRSYLDVFSEAGL